MIMKCLHPTKNDHRFPSWLILLLLLSGCLIPLHAEEPFVPGAGGSLPSFTEFQPMAGHVGGFVVYSSTRHNNWFGSGTYAEVNMSFPNAAAYGCETIVLQYKKVDGTWASYLNNQTELTTTGDNFSLELSQTYTLRLLLRGGAQNGSVSNEQVAELAQADTYFSQVTLDESMFLTGVMVPWVGRGLQVSYIVKKLSDGSVVDGGLSYQWYRVNPITFETTLIPGANNLLYATTVSDLGFRIMAVATGNQTTVGGFYKMLSGTNIVSPNKSFVTNPTLSGFTLNLYQDVAKLDTGDLFLRDKDYLKVPITSVTKSPSSGVFQINASLSLDKNPYTLLNKSIFWRICTEMEFGPMHDLMEGASIDLTAATALGQLSQKPALNVSYDASSKHIRFESVSTVNEVSLYSLAGSLLGNWKMGQSQGSVSIRDVTPGVYVMRFTTTAGSVAKKVMVTN